MVHNSVYLYPNKIDVFTNLLDPWTIERYKKVYIRNLKVYRGADNRIDIQVKNCNQKATSVANTYLVFALVTKEDQRLLLKKDFVLIPDGTTQSQIGRAYLDLSRTELLDLEPGFYQYSITQETRTYNDDGYIVLSKVPMYTDSQFGVYANLEIFGDVEGEPVPSLVVDKFEYVNPFALADENPKFYVSSIIDADPHKAVPQSIHTFQFYFNNYSGTVHIEGSIEEQGATPKKWNVIQTLSSTNNLEYANIIGKYSWFRIRHIPTTGSTGTLDKILYR